QKQVVENPQSGEIPAEEAKASLASTYQDLARVFRQQRRYAEALDHARQAEAMLRDVGRSGRLTKKRQEQVRQGWALAALEVGRSAFPLGQADV
ncbi:tetratricopeptide repeat protein, partial [Salmonella sp. SAL4434]|uniref:tetratricopeptide repeat protein n=1 Tax=Salmonella sp. SAL4434 TaxID=3159889 RepID=UPI00397BDD1B